MTRRSLLALAALSALILPTMARGHSLLVRSQPDRRSTVTRAPDRVRLWFSERLEPAYARLTVWDGAGRQVDAGDAAVDAADPTLLSVATPALDPGRYTVRYRVLSVDGHVVESSFTFTFKPAGAAR